MSEITIHVLDSESSFHLTFKPLDSKGHEVPPTGVVQCVSSDVSIATVMPDGAGDHAQQLVMLTGATGPCDLTFHDDLVTVVVHLIVDNGVETDATVIKTP